MWKFSEFQKFLNIFLYTRYKKRGANMEGQKIGFKSFIDKVLSGVALGIVLGLVPNAILGEVFKALQDYGDVFKTLHAVVIGIQFTVPIIVGVLIGIQFKLNSIQVVVVGTAAFVGSGAYVYKNNYWIMSGIGDLINTMITASIAVLLILYIKEKLGSLTIILLPILVGGVSGFIGLLTLPYVKLITTGIGELINSFTSLQPLFMSILISIAFAILIVSPISTVAIAMAIGISGVASGAANVGISASACMLIIGTIKVNKSGVPVAIALGAMKMMMPNLLKHPIIILPISITAGIAGIFSSIFTIQGTKESAGFGFSGLVGPINAMKFMDGSIVINVIIIAFVYFFIPMVSAIITHKIMLSLNIYNKDVFKFEESKEEN